MSGSGARAGAARRNQLLSERGRGRGRLIAVSAPAVPHAPNTMSPLVDPSCMPARPPSQLLAPLILHMFCSGASLSQRTPCARASAARASRPAKAPASVSPSFLRPSFLPTCSRPVYYAPAVLLLPLVSPLTCHDHDRLRCTNLRQPALGVSPPSDARTQPSRCAHMPSPVLFAPDLHVV